MADQGSEARVTESERPEASSNRRVSETAYPYWGLTHAIEMVQAIRRAGGKEAPSDAVMREMGIATKTDRRWTYGVPSAKLFNLVERIGRGDAGRLKVTDLALRLTNPASSEAERLAKIAALRTPELYGKLLERYSGSAVPTAEGLKNLLFTDYGIVESMAMMAAEAFIDSVKAAGVVSPVGLIVIEGGAAPAAATDKKTPTPTEEAAPADKQTVFVPKDFVIYKAKISGGRIIDIPVPPKLKASDVDKIHKLLLTQIDDDGEEVPA